MRQNKANQLLDEERAAHDARVAELLVANGNLVDDCRAHRALLAYARDALLGDRSAVVIEETLRAMEIEGPGKRLDAVHAELHNWDLAAYKRLKAGGKI